MQQKRALCQYMAYIGLQDPAALGSHLAFRLSQHCGLILRGFEAWWNLKGICHTIVCGMQVGRSVMILRGLTHALGMDVRVRSFILND